MAGIKNNKEVKKVITKKATDTKEQEKEMMLSFQNVFNMFQEQVKAEYGMIIGCRIVYTESGLHAALVPVKVPNESTNNEETK